MRGVVAAGHPQTAHAGALALRAGGNAVDAGLSAMFCSFATEPLLTGLGAGGYMLVAAPGRDPMLLDFFVSAPGLGADGEKRQRVQLHGIDVDFGETVQRFHIGPGSVAPYGTLAGAAAAIERYATLPVSELVAPAVAAARDGVLVNEQQAYLFELLEPICTATEQACSHFMPTGSPARVGDRYRDPELAEALLRFAAEGTDPFYRGDIAAAVCDWISARGGALTRADLASYRVIAREPVAVSYRGFEVLSNPPPSAGGILLALSLARLDRDRATIAAADLVAVMAAAQDERTDEFHAGLHEPDFGARLLASRLGATTHISAVDCDGWACSVTVSNGEGSGELVPGTGIHLNNTIGELDLSPLGLQTHLAGRRLPSMMAPTLVLEHSSPRLAIGSAGSNRIRSAILQIIVGSLDRGLDAQAAVDAPRLHFEDGWLYTEPGVEATDHDPTRTVSFAARNLFFGGVQVAARDPSSGELGGGADSRRGGAVAFG